MNEHEARAIPSIAPPLGPVPGVVRHLEEALAKAQRGEVRGVAIVLVNTQREVWHMHDTGDGGLASMVLGTAYLQQELLAEGTT